MTTEILCEDAIAWLARQREGSIPHIITGMPDMDEIEAIESKTISKREYVQQFQKMSRLLFTRLSPAGYMILFQTDRKLHGEWIDKSHLLQTVASETGHNLMWHKIIINREGTYIQRPTYTHMLCFSRENKPGEAFPDVMPVGTHIYKNATSTNALCWAMDFMRHKGVRRVVDPFVGRGSIPYIANMFGVDALGIDIDPKQCRYAREILGDTRMHRIVLQSDYFKHRGTNMLVNTTKREDRNTKREEQEPEKRPRGRPRTQRAAHSVPETSEMTGGKRDMRRETKRRMLVSSKRVKFDLRRSRTRLI